jgi:hypothetical protein
MVVVSDVMNKDVMQVHKVKLINVNDMVVVSDVMNLNAKLVL